MAMDLFEIKREYFLGIKEIDDQHVRILKLIKQMGAARGSASEHETIMAVLKQMIRYSQEHFAYEKSLMDGQGYPEEAAHRQAHVDYNSQLQDMANRFLVDGHLDPVEIITFLWRWWTEHIQQVDRIWATWHLVQTLEI